MTFPAMIKFFSHMGQQHLRRLSILPWWCQGRGAIAQGRVAALLVRPVEPAPRLKEGNKVGESSRRNEKGATLPAE